MGSTAVLLIGWRALLFSVIPTESKKKDDTYRKGSAFELFEVCECIFLSSRRKLEPLLTSVSVFILSIQRCANDAVAYFIDKTVVKEHP